MRIKLCAQTDSVQTCFKSFKDTFSNDMHVKIGDKMLENLTVRLTSFRLLNISF